MKTQNLQAHKDLYFEMPNKHTDITPQPTFCPSRGQIDGNGAGRFGVDVAAGQAAVALETLVNQRFRWRAGSASRMGEPVLWMYAGWMHVLACV